MNPIIEIDTLRHRREMNVDNWCKLLKKRFEWIKKHYGSDAKIFVNFRDFSDAMFHDVAPVLKIALFMGMLPPDLRPFGLMFEEPRGTYMPEEVGKWCGGKTFVKKALFKDNIFVTFPVGLFLNHNCFFQFKF